LVFNDGDFVKVDYSAWRIADSKLVYTSMKKVAEGNEIYDENIRYVPQLVIIGKKSAIKGFEDAIKGMSVNETKKVEIAPKDAFGERHPELIKVLPISDFLKRDIAPYPGMQLDLDGAVATIKSVNSGRVIVDANHPLAGEKLMYEIRLIEKVEKEDDKIRAIADTYSLTPDSVAVSAGNAKVVFGEKTAKDKAYLVNKNDFVGAVLAFMSSISKVTVEEDYVREKKEEEGKDKGAE